MTMSKHEREAKWALDFRREITRARLSRREIMKLGVLGTGTAFLGLGSQGARAQDMISPPTEPFVDALPLPKTATDAGFEVTEAQFADHGSSRMDGTVLRSISGAPAKAEHDCRTAAWKQKFQYVDRFKPKRFYILPTQEVAHKWHRDLPASTMWCHGDQFPGVTIVANYGEPVVVRHANELPANPNLDYGAPVLLTHLHNFHSGSESDGGPWGVSDRRVVAEPSDAPWFRDHYYTMARAGFTDPQFENYYGNKSTTNAVMRAAWNHYNTKADRNFMRRYDLSAGNWGDPAETLNTMFYHSHVPDFTTANVYKGMAGLFIARDELDTGDETTGLRLPSGKYDVPLAMCDKVFDQNGQLFFDTFNLDGILGDKPTVNGVIQPYFNVDCRRYRFRMLNTGPSRILQLYLYNKTTNTWLTNPFLQIASDGNLLERPVARGFIMNSVAERYDVLVDFNRIAKPGHEIIMYNRADQTDGRKPTGKLLSPGIPVMKFIVGAKPAVDTSYDYFSPVGLTQILRPYPQIDLKKVVARRNFDIGRSGGSWTINGKIFEPSIASSQAKPTRNTAEIWTMSNSSGGWVHPMHIHFEEGRILSRNGVAPPVHERGRKDLYHVNTNEKVDIFINFRDFPDPNYNPPNPAYKPEAGRYVMHCHNTVHEDHAMMCRFDVVNPPTLA
ncbi:MAG: multicopper oxidase family protein [Gammaproteobacteria bacterium]